MIYPMRPNWLFLVAVTVAALLPAVYKLTPFDPRPASAAVGFVAFMVLGFQFADKYRRTPTSTRVAVVIIGLFLLLGAVASAQLANRGGVALTFATYPLFGVRIGCLLFGVHFGRILDLENRTPWIKTRA